ncbi:hypothetical protein D8674_002063 [Pyrus ussuriensis x Pyrus communis]|uniref:Retrovirus-related Pol polyprotein from transposon TNT 1-94 n=1 Tax=Pyrus ussuriensis x Pyrus communis TaxID=2448454 RepID=A0A5N5FD66_9ROSA|nr:hypothetical protein D8674_002063 [Pyrus ussuriensis x Pyrus communis]
MSAPQKYLRDFSGNRTSTLNPQYVTWFENDHNILIWINFTLLDTLISHTVRVNSARELSSKLESRLATDSQSHIHELRSRLRSITKGDSTAVLYLQQIEEITYALANARAPIEDSELLSVILHGLPSEYEFFIDAIQFHLGSATIDELHGLLLSNEMDLLRNPMVLQIVATSLNLAITTIVDHRGIIKVFRAIKDSIVVIWVIIVTTVVLVLSITIPIERFLVKFVVNWIMKLLSVLSA